MLEEKSDSTPVGAGNGVEASTGGALNFEDTTAAPVVVKAAEPDPDNIPEELKSLPFWVIYQRREKGGKVTPFGQPKQDKVPLQPRHPFAPASTAEAKHCGSFEEAREALRQCPQADGLGLVLTHAWMDAPDLVALDFDGLRDPHTEEIAPDKRAGWETIKALASYTEVSPSGEGFRVFCFGSAGGAFNRDGVEAYPTGGAARFVTVTGAHVEGFPLEPRPVHNLADLLDPHRPAEKPEAGTGEDSGLPNTPPPLPEDVPERSVLSLSDDWQRFLENCDQPPERFENDRSRALQSVTTALLAQGREPAEVLAVLVHSDAFRLALDHRGQNEAKAMQYLWDGIRKAAARNPSAVAVAEDFPDLGAVERDERHPWERGAFRLTRVTDMACKPLEWLVHGLFPRHGLAEVFAPPASGKSFFAIGLACAIATGREYCGRELESGPVVYIAGEGHHGIQQRVHAWAAFHGVGEDVLSNLFVSEVPANLTDSESVEHVRAALKAVAEEAGPPCIIVIDTLARNFGSGDENSTKDMNTFVTHCDRLRADWGALVLVVHHTGHTNQDRGRGASPLLGAMDAEYRMAKDPDGTVRLVCKKMKDAPEPEPLAFSLQAQSLDLEDPVTGEPVSSAVLVPTDYTEPPRKGTKGKGERQQEALRLLCDLEAFPDEDGGEGVPLSKWRGACKAVGMHRSSVGDVVKKLTEPGGPVERFNTGGQDRVRTIQQ